MLMKTVRMAPKKFFKNSHRATNGLCSSTTLVILEHSKHIPRDSIFARATLPFFWMEIYKTRPNYSLNSSKNGLKDAQSSMASGHDVKDRLYDARAINYFIASLKP